MKPKALSVATLGGLLAALMGLIVMAGCGGSSSSASSSGTPAITLSTTALAFSSGVGIPSSPQVITITNTGTAELAFSSFVLSNSVFTQTNTCGTGIAADGSCTISVMFSPTAAGTVTGTLTITDNASGSPQTVALSGTGNSVSVYPSTLTFSGVALGNTSAPQSVTLSNAATTALAVTSVTISGDFAISNNTCGSSVAASGNCTISVTFTPEGSAPWTGTLTIVDGAGTQTVALTGTTTFANTASVSVNFGPNGYQGVGESYYNGIFATVTVCEPGSTTNCATVPNVLVDTGSVGLRILSNQLGSVTLPQVNDPSTGYPVYECVQYGDLSYTWGPMQLATVQIGGETASQVPASSGGTANSGIPIQVISVGVTPPTEVGVVGSNEGFYNPCLTLPGSDGEVLSGGTNDDSVATLEANGILGIGSYPQDCGADCTSLDTTTGAYLICESVGSSNCDIESIPLQDQAWSPVSAFPVDNNGVVLNLPSIPAAGQATVTGTYLTFGIGTQSNNALTTQTVYELDNNGLFESLIFGGVTYSGSNGGVLDSGSNALVVSDAATLTSVTDVSTVTCTDNAYYCPSSTLNLNITLGGFNGSNSGPVTLNIANADALFSGNQNAAFSDLGAPSCIPTTGSSCDASTDSWDLGLPFFYGRTIFVNIAGTNSTYPNGFWAF